MPRGRIISPDFWSDGRMVGLSPFARLFYIGTWNFAMCDKGHLPDDPVGLKLKILPSDPVDAVALLDELMAVGRVVRIESDARPFLHIPTFESYQKADTRWKSRCPVCAHSDSTKLTETPPSLVEHTQTLPNSSRRGEERKGEEKRGEEAPRSPYCNRHPGGTDKPCGACGSARLLFEAHMKSQQRFQPSVPSIPHPPTPDTCEAHKYLAGYCVRCGGREVAA